MIHAAVGAAAGASASDWPVTVGDVLRATAKEQCLRALALSFVAATISGQDVHVCWAGDVRAHLVENEGVVAATADDVLGEESPDWIARTYGEIDITSHRTMLTRTVTSDRPPKRASWRAAGPNGVVFVCSGPFHRHQPVTTYTHAALGKGVLDDEAAVLVVQPNEGGSGS